MTKRFGSRTAIEDLSFDAPAGQVTGLLGPNGAGKTTTFRVLLGLAAPTAGSATINGLPYAQLHHPRCTVGALLEVSGFHPARSGRNHLRVLCAAAGIADRRADEVLELVGLTSAATRKVGGYSLGMRQRLALAGALLGDPPVIVLDEPTNGLDPEGVAWIRRLARQWAGEGRCVVIASHLLAEVAQAVDRVVIISRGRVVRELAVDELGADQELVVGCSDSAALARALQGRGHPVTRVEDRLVVRGIGAEDVGRLAADLGVVIYSLGGRSTGEALEDLFLRLTGSGMATQPNALGGVR